MGDSTLLGLMSAALIVGLMSGVHCSAMCGGLLAAITPAARRPGANSSQRYTWALHSGRLASYMLAGAVAGSLGGALVQTPALHNLHMAFMLLANLLLIAAGLNLAGIAAVTRTLEKLGVPLWRRLQPLLKRVLPLNSAPRALLAGGLWGWLPCGMTYAVLPSALAAGSVGSGAMVMLAFGLGTLPNLLALTFLWSRLQASGSLARVRLGAGLAVIALGVIGIALLGSHMMAMRHG
jgi:sulfite exporter TauE/SafE